MKKLSLLLIFAIALMPLLSKAQSTTTGGPELSVNDKSLVWVLEDNSEFLRIAYVEISPMGMYDDIFISTYNKQSNTGIEQNVDEDFEGRFVFLTDDGMLNIVQQYFNRKTKMLEYRKSSFPKDAKVPRKMEFSPFYSIPLDKMKSVFVKAAYSEDMTKFAIYTVLKTNDWRNPKHDVDVAVFDAEGTLLWHQTQQANDWFHAESFLLSNDGTVYLADYGNIRNPYAGLSDYLIVSVFTEQGVESQKIELDCASFSCEKVLLANGEMRVVGVGENKEGGYFLSTYKVAQDGSVDYSQSDITLSTEIDGVAYDNLYAKQTDKYEPCVFTVIKLSDGKLFLTGEMCRRVEVGTYRDTDLPLYGRQSQNMFYAVLTEDGIMIESNEYPRSVITKSDFGDRNMMKRNPVDVFEYDRDVYLLYNDHRDNFKGSGQSCHTLQNNVPNQCCVVMSKVESNGELQNSVLYLAKTNMKDPRYIAQQRDHEYYLKLVKVSEDGIYYILKNDGEYRLEKISVE